MDVLIKRYQNRKLYDTQNKRYINLSDIETMIQRNEDVKIIDNVSGDDITRQVLVQLLMRKDTDTSQKKLPLDGLREMIQGQHGPFAQAFKGVMNMGREFIRPAGEQSNQLTGLAEMIRKVSDTAAEKAVKVVDGSLARELLKVPTRDDWQRIESKFSELEDKLSELESNGGSCNDK